MSIYPEMILSTIIRSNL